MVSKSQIKLINSLKQKKYRKQHNLFVAEGIKTITELINSDIELYQLFTTEPFNSDAKSEILITENELKKISFLKTPNQALALFKVPSSQTVTSNGLILVLDDVQDPGNLGTIIRLCDWFGIENLICSPNTVDCYNPKVIQATMGSISRVNLSYMELEQFIKRNKLPIYGAFMNGTNVYTSKLHKQGILIMGNEANGISEELEKLIQHRIAIPRFGAQQETESLNVATATAILLSEFRRGFTGK